MKDKKKRLVLLDVHAILHRAYHALPDFSSSKGEPTGGLYGLSTMLLKIIEELKPDYIAACYDLPQKTYRHEAYDGYKAGRKKADDALVSQIVRSRDIFTAFGIPMYEKAGFEADDILGTIVEQVESEKFKVTRGGEDKEIEIVIASGDMDTLQLVEGEKVQVYTLKKGIKDTVLYDEDQVKSRFGFGPKLLPDYKGLRGDPSDNIIGIKGIGEKTATLIIKEFGTIEELYAVVKKSEERFKKIGITPRIISLLREGEEEAIFSKMLAEIRRDAPIEFSLPEKNCSDALDLPRLTALFSELEFRTLSARVKNVFGLEDLKTNGGETKQASFDEIQNEPIDQRELKETSTALWVLNSNLPNPSSDEILHFAKTSNFSEARKIILDEIEKRGLSNVFKDIELPLIDVLEKMEKRGIRIDVSYLKQLSLSYHEELAKLEKKIFALAQLEFNINSPKQLGQVLFEKMGLIVKGLKKTEGGAQSTRESELIKLKDTHPIIEIILSHRELQKLLSTYIDTIPLMVDSKSRLHTTWLQAGATTGRMASQNPNLQNIPIKTELGRAIRNAFVAENGFSIVTFDYSQIELRIAAFLSGDEKLLEIFRQGIDVHTAVASRVFKIPLDQVDKEMRRKAKVINFGIMYGMGVNALKTNLGSDRKEAQKFYDDYFETFKTLASYLDRVKASALRQGYTETFFGRRRYFEGLRSPIPYIKAGAERMAINAPIQGTEADIIKLAMVYVDEYVKKEKLEGSIFPLLQVHDELVYEIKDSLVEKVSPRIKKIMESVLDPKEIKGIVCLAEVRSGRSWGELESY